MAAAAPQGHLATLEHEIVNIDGRHSRRDARSAVGHRDDQIECLDRELQKHNHHCDKDRADCRQDNPSIDPRHTRAVYLRGFNEIRIDRPQTGQEESHNKARRLPDTGDHHRVNRHFALHQPVELKARPAELMHQALNAGRAG